MIIHHVIDWHNVRLTGVEEAHVVRVLLA